MRAAVLTILFLTSALEAAAYFPKIGDSAELLLLELGEPSGIVGAAGEDQILTYDSLMIGLSAGRVAWIDRRVAGRSSTHSEAERVKNVYLSDPNAVVMSDVEIVDLWESYKLRFPGEVLPGVYREAKARLAEEESRVQEAEERAERAKLEQERAEREEALLEELRARDYYYADPIVSVGTILSIQENALCELKASRAAAIRTHNQAEVRRLDGLIYDTKSFIGGIKARISWTPFSGAGCAAVRTKAFSDGGVQVTWSAN